MSVDMFMWIAAIIGAISAWATKRPFAWPFVASLAWTTFLDYRGVPFNPFFWGTFDVCVILTCMFMDVTRAPDEPKMEQNDIIALLLFAPTWVFYALTDGWLLCWGTTAVVVTQFLLFVPWESVKVWTLKWWSAVCEHFDGGGRLDVIAHAPKYRG